MVDGGGQRKREQGLFSPSASRLEQESKAVPCERRGAYYYVTGLLGPYLVTAVVWGELALAQRPLPRLAPFR